MVARAAVSTLICCFLDGRPAGAAAGAASAPLPGMTAPVILARSGAGEGPAEAAAVNALTASAAAMTGRKTYLNWLMRMIGFPLAALPAIGPRGHMAILMKLRPARKTLTGSERDHGSWTGWMTTGPRVGSSSVAWETLVGVITSTALGTVAGSAEQIGAVPPGAHTPNVKAPGVAVKARAWSALNPSWPVSTTLKPQPVVGVPNCASGSATVIVRSACTGSTDAVPTEPPAAFTHAGEANPWTSTRWLQAPDGAMV